MQEKILAAYKEEQNLHIQAREILINSLKTYLSEFDTEIQRSKYEDIALLENIPEKYSTNIIENRPDYKIKEANLKKTGFNIQVAKKEFLPSFTIFGQIGLNAYRLGSLFNSPSQFFNAGILPNIDLFSGGRKKAFLKARKYEYEQAANSYQKALLTGIKEINSGLVEYKTAKKNYAETLKRIEIEGKIYNLAEEKNKIGANSKLDILLAKELDLIAKKDEVSNKINLIISTIGLYKVAGGVDLYYIEKL